jgi:hypothetical protein
MATLSASGTKLIDGIVGDEIARTSAKSTPTPAPAPAPAQTQGASWSWLTIGLVGGGMVLIIVGVIVFSALKPRNVK